MILNSFVSWLLKMVNKMLNLPRSTELNKFLPKKAIYDKFNMNTQEKDNFDLDVKKLVIANEISPVTMNVTIGENVEAIFVINVQLKKETYNEKNIALISKLINQKIIFVLEYSGKARLAVFYQKLLQTKWEHTADNKVDLKGLNLNQIWENIIIQISGIELQANKTIDEQIKLNETKTKLKLQIELVERQARTERQPKKKIELVERLNKLKSEMECLN